MPQASYMQNERFTFYSPVLSAEYECKVLRFSGTEGLNILYNFDIQLMSNTPLDTTALLAAPAYLRIARGDAPPVTFHGYPTALTQKGHINGWTFYTLTLQPQLAKLRHIVQNCIYLEKNTKDIVKDALGNCGILKPDHAFVLHKSYPTHEFSMQYNENILDFIAYHLERDGVYYYFEQRDNAERVVFTDSPMNHTYLPDGKELRYAPTSGLEGSHTEEIIVSFIMQQIPLPKEVYVRDFDWKKPNMTMEATAIVDERGLGTLSFFGDGFNSTHDAQRLANIRAESLRCRGTIFQGTSSVPTLRTGYLFNLYDHYDENFDASYFITSVTHEGSQEAYLSSVLGLPLENPSDKLYYRNSFTCIPESVQFRPERITERKKISGMIHAFIDTSSDAVTPEIDAFGRYKVIFPQDTSGRSRGKASCWVRRAQPSVGVGYGTSFPLDPGVEVLISFVDGNPDKPFIAGAMSNPESGFADSADTALLSGMRGAGGGGLTFNDTAEKQGLNLNTGSGRSGLFMASGSMDSAFWQSDYTTQFSTAITSSFATLKSSLEGGLSASLAASSTLKNKKIISLALSALTTITSGLQSAGAAQSTAAEAELKSAITATKSAKAQLTAAQKAKENADIDLQKQNVRARTLADNPNATEEEKQQARDDAEVAGIVAATANTAYNDAQLAHTAATKAEDDAKKKQAGASTWNESWTGLTTLLKTMNILNTCYHSAKDLTTKSDPLDPSPYGTVISSSQTKNAVDLDISPSASHTRAINAFMASTLAARVFSTVASTNVAFTEQEKLEKDLQTSTTDILQENEYQRLRTAKKAQLQKEGKNSARINAILASEEKNLRAHATTNVNQFSSHDRAVATDNALKENVSFKQLTEQYQRKIAAKKSANARMVTTTVASLMVEVLASLTMFKTKYGVWQNTPHGGIKLTSKTNIASSTPHHYLSADKGLSLVSLPEAGKYINTVAAKELNKIHDDYLGIDTSHTHITAETEQLRLSALKDATLFGVECAIKSAKTLTITNQFQAADKQTIQATLKKLDKNPPLSLLALQASVDNAMAVMDGVSMNALFGTATAEEEASAQAELDAAKAALKTEKARVIQAILALETPKTFSEMTLQRENNEETLTLMNKGKTLTIKQEAKADSEVHIIREQAREKLSNIKMTQNSLSAMHQNVSDSKITMLSLAGDSADLSHDGTRITLSKKKITLLASNDEKITLEKGDTTLQNKNCTIQSTKTLTLNAKNDVQIQGKTGITLEGGSSNIIINNSGVTQKGSLIRIA